MKLKIEFPLNVYDRLIDTCDQSSREYRLLENGCLVRRPSGDHFERIFEILCEIDEAKELLDFARRINNPDAAEVITKSIDLFHER